MTYEDELLATWLGSDASAGPDDGLEAALATARGIRQRPAWLVTLTGGTIAQPQGALLRFAALAAALVSLVGLTIGVLALGGVLPRPQPAPSVVGIATEEPSPDPSAVPSVQPTEPPAQLVAYMRTDVLEPGQGTCSVGAPAYRCRLDRIWIARADGSDARPLHPDRFTAEVLRGWMPDGSGLLTFEPQGPLALVAADGGVIDRWGRDVICPSPCADAGDFTVSPDGNRIAFVRRYGDERGDSVIAILDLATAGVTELEATRVTNPIADCWSGAACPGLNEDPQWSPDGSRLAFSREVMSPDDRESGPRTTAAVYVVDADGAGLQRVTPVDWFGFQARWSPDGSQLVLVHVPDRALIQTDVFTVRPDGSQLTALTDDGRSGLAHWTAEGRILFVRHYGATFVTHWVMDADGGDPRPVPTALADLTAIGCVVCVSAEAAYASIEDPLAYWQPMP